MLGFVDSDTAGSVSFCSIDHLVSDSANVQTVYSMAETFVPDFAAECLAPDFTTVLDLLMFILAIPVLVSFTTTSQTGS